MYLCNFRKTSIQNLQQQAFSGSEIPAQKKVGVSFRPLILLSGPRFNVTVAHQHIGIIVVAETHTVTDGLGGIKRVFGSIKAYITIYIFFPCNFTVIKVWRS